MRKHIRVLLLGLDQMIHTVFSRHTAEEKAPSERRCSLEEELLYWLYFHLLIIMGYGVKLLVTVAVTVVEFVLMTKVEFTTHCSEANRNISAVTLLNNQSSRRREARASLQGLLLWRLTKMLTLK